MKTIKETLRELFIDFKQVIIFLLIFWLIGFIFLIVERLLPNEQAYTELKVGYLYAFMGCWLIPGYFAIYALRWATMYELLSDCFKYVRGTPLPKLEFKKDNWKPLAINTAIALMIFVIFATMPIVAFTSVDFHNDTTLFTNLVCAGIFGPFYTILFVTLLSLIVNLAYLIKKSKARKLHLATHPLAGQVEQRSAHDL